jgi:hypothetical protein
MTKRPPDIHVEASIPAHYVRLRCGCGAVIYALCLSEIKLAHTNDEVRQEMA